jgi:hypothetical protein
MERRYYWLKAGLIVLGIVALSSMAQGSHSSPPAVRFDAAISAEMAVVRSSTAIFRATERFLETHAAQFAE